MFSCCYDLADAGDHANSDIGTLSKVCGKDEFGEKMQEKSQKCTGGVSMLNVTCF
jgi:hypothetical protein